MGAAAIAPGNTEASFRTALAVGVDMLEFDVLPERLDGTGELFLAHDPADLAARRETVLTLEQGLDLLVGLDVPLNVDLKVPGYERRVADALRARGAVERALASSTYPVSLRRMRLLAPDMRLGLSVPRLRRDPLRSPVTVLPALAALQVLRRVLPARAARAIREGRCEALMANVHLVTPALVRAVQGAGGELHVWTVDDAARIARLREAGVDAVISNDPRLFAAQPPTISQVAAE